MLASLEKIGIRLPVFTMIVIAAMSSWFHAIELGSEFDTGNTNSYAVEFFIIVSAALFIAAGFALGYGTGAAKITRRAEK